jgi:hypothetical protein
MKQITALILASVAIIAIAGEDGAFRSQSNAEVRQLFLDAAEMDGEPGATIVEVVKAFGVGDKTTNKSPWKNGEHHIYILTQDRRMELDVLNGNVMLAIISNPNKESYLIWK